MDEWAEGMQQQEASVDFWCDPAAIGQSPGGLRLVISVSESGIVDSAQGEHRRRLYSLLLQDVVQVVLCSLVETIAAMLCEKMNPGDRLIFCDSLASLGSRTKRFQG